MNINKFLITVGIALSACFSTGASAETVKMSGYIREVSCNDPSGLGYLKLEQFTGRRRHLHKVDTYLRVNSRDLCSSDAPPQFSRLTSIGYDGIFEISVKYFEVTIENGYVTAISNGTEQTEQYLRLMRRVTGDFRVVDANNVQYWFLNGPAQIHYGQSNMDDLIRQYTTN